MDFLEALWSIGSSTVVHEDRLEMPLGRLNAYSTPPEGQSATVANALGKEN